MLMTNENVRLYFHDRVLAGFIRLLPARLRPNHLTALRFLLTPFVIWYVWYENWIVALPLFFVAALTDVIDGSLARLRKQITMWGTLADPAADKLLIGSVALIFVARELHLAFTLLIIGIEILVIVSGALRRRQNRIISANWAGKLKMLFQVLGVLFLLLGKLIETQSLTPYSIASFIIAIFFGVISLITYSL